jgi:hypothetical protein
MYGPSDTSEVCEECGYRRIEPINQSAVAEKSKGRVTSTVRP